MIAPAHHVSIVLGYLIGTEIAPVRHSHHLDKVITALIAIRGTGYLMGLGEPCCTSLIKGDRSLTLIAPPAYVAQREILILQKTTFFTYLLHKHWS